MLSYIIFYRILEYASFNFGRQELRRPVRRIVENPTRFSDTEKITRDVISILNSEKDYYEVQRFNDLVREHVPSIVLWQDFSQHLGFYSEPITFDGGFRIDPVVHENCDFDSFSKNATTIVAKNFREIQNVLSHGKDFSYQGVIQLSRRNIDLLRPYSHLIRAAVGEVILHGP